jgi:hypothetical protein
MVFREPEILAAFHAAEVHGPSAEDELQFAVAILTGQIHIISRLFESLTYLSLYQIVKDGTL